MALWGMDEMLSGSILQHIIRMNIIENNSKITVYRPGTFVRGIPGCDWRSLEAQETCFYYSSPCKPPTCYYLFMSSILRAILSIITVYSIKYYKPIDKGGQRKPLTGNLYERLIRSGWRKSLFYFTEMEGFMLK